MSDLTFNPTAAQGDADWRVLYVSTGDGGTGEQTDVRRLNPQRLDHFGGAIIRIVPDLREHVSTSQVSENGQYRIPNDNPFVSTPGARKEIFAHGANPPAPPPAPPAGRAGGPGAGPGGPAGPRPLRIELRIATDEAGEIYLLTKSDGFIRRVVILR